jgi:hypothetical protein
VRSAVILGVAFALLPGTARADGFSDTMQRCLSRSDRQACTARTLSERAELVSIGRDFAGQTQEWIETAPVDALEAAAKRDPGEVARMNAIFDNWGLPHFDAPDIVALIGAEKACRASPKCLADRQAAKEEQAFFTGIVQPMCVADQDREIARADLARERSNPSGVVDLRRMHLDGASIQSDERTLASLARDYVARRHHAWPGWRAECH